MPGCQISSIHARVWLLVLSASLSLVLSHLFVTSVLQVPRAAFFSPPSALGLVALTPRLAVCERQDARAPWLARLP